MSNICCFTGHRDINIYDYERVVALVETAIARLIEDEAVTEFRAGGARGFDCIAASCVLHLKSKYPQIKLHLVLPCKNQDKYFARHEKMIYKYVLENADSVEYIQEKYSNGVMMARNRALVDGSDICLAYLTRLTGGTYQTVAMARKSGLKVLNVNKII